MMCFSWLPSVWCLTLTLLFIFAVVRAPLFSCRMQSVTKEGLSFGDEDVADVKKREKYYKKVFSPLAEHLKDLFKGKISKVFAVGR